LSTLFRFALVLILGFLFAYGMIPMIIRGAIRLRVLDFPSDARRIHRIAVPRLGGVAVFLSIALSMVAIVLYDGVQGVGRPYLAELLPLAIALSMVFGIGLIDDVIGVRPRTKLVVQTIAALVMVSSAGFVPNSVVLATGFQAIPLGYLAAPLTVIWIVGVTNAFNLIDGMDGLAGTAALIGITVCIGLDAIYPAAHSPELMLAAAGAVVAFLVFNRHPARIFLGDAGSMVLGFLLAVRLLGCATETGGRTFLLVPLFTLALPLMDTAIAIARRWLRGDPFSQADGRHIHHQFLALGISPRVTVELLGFFFAGIAVLGVSIAFAPPRFTLALMLAAGATLFATFWYGLRWLRYHEFLALGGSMASVMRNARVALKEKIRTDEVAKQLQHAGSFDEVCEIIAALVGQTRLLDIEVFESSTDLHAHGPSRQRISAFDALPVRFDYPFTHVEGERPREMVLRIWCPRPSSIAPSYTAERVAARIGPALESWFRGRDHPAAEVGEVPDARPHLERSAESRLTGDRPSRS
jgi:UDP-GlcNAc:undecaprenyl-phosphate GlcNAc-1-phosphate transferase